MPNARPRDWHVDEGLVTFTATDDSTKRPAARIGPHGFEGYEWLDDEPSDTDPRPGARIALLVVGIAFAALILGAIALASMLYDPSGHVRHTVSAQPQSWFLLGRNWLYDFLFGP